MALESASSIADLVATNPTSGDPKAQGDDHLRLIKAVLLADLVNNSTKAATGSIEFPDGTTINWGTASTNGSGVATFTWNNAFTSSCWGMWPAQGSGNYSMIISITSTTGGTVTVRDAGTGSAAGAGITVFVLAIGN